MYARCRCAHATRQAIVLGACPQEQRRHRCTRRRSTCSSSASASSESTKRTQPPCVVEQTGLPNRLADRSRLLCSCPYPFPTLDSRFPISATNAARGCRAQRSSTPLSGSRCPLDAINAVHAATRAPAAGPAACSVHLAALFGCLSPLSAQAIGTRLAPLCAARTDQPASAPFRPARRTMRPSSAPSALNAIAEIERISAVPQILETVASVSYTHL